MRMIAVMLAAGLGSSAALADEHMAWADSPYGPEDQAGASNLMVPAKTLQAVQLIKTGQVISLGRTLEPGIPMFGDRAFAVRGTSGLAGPELGKNHVIYMDDFVAADLGQVGTQFDGLAHIGIGGKHGHHFYNGTPGEEVYGPTGVQKLGIEHIKPFFTRGIVLDITAVRGRDLEAGEEIMVADIEAALQKQGLAPPGKGDVVLFHTGWGKLWMKDNEKFNAGCPGIGLEAAAYLIEKGIVIAGSDTWPVEVVPNPNPELIFPVHQEFLTKQGIFNHENVATERLIEAGVHEFAYIFSPVPIKGATGSAGAPLAVY